MTETKTITEATATAAETTDAKPSATTPQLGPMDPNTDPVNGYWWGTGRRKSAIARVRIRPGNGQFVINKREIDKFFSVERDRKDIVAPLSVTRTGKHLDVFVNVVGGGTTGQAGAIVLGLARALSKYNEAYMPVLRDQHFLTRDSREVERKKYGQRGARRRFQFSKR